MPTCCAKEPTQITYIPSAWSSCRILISLAHKPLKATQPTLLLTLPPPQTDTASLSGNDALLRALSRLETKFDGLKSNFDGVRSDLDDIKTEFTEFRGRLDSLESRSRGPSSPVAQTFTVPPTAATATKEAEADTTYRDPDNFHTVTRKFTVFSPDAPPPAKPRPPVNEHIQLTLTTLR